MTDKQRNAIARGGLAVMLLSPAMYVFVVWASYGGENRVAPWSGTNSWWLLAIAVFGGAAGGCFFVRGRPARRTAGYAMLGLYVVIGWIALTFANGFVACMHGDCF